MYDSLNRDMLGPYGCDRTLTPNFRRLAARTVTFDNCYVCSLPCVPARRELLTLGGPPARQISVTSTVGIGMVFAVDAAEADAVIAALTACGESAYRIGEVGRTGEDGERLVLR